MPTANMNLPDIDPGDTDYPTNFDDMQNLLDLHDHSSGNGVQIPTGGITDLAVTAAKLASDSVTTTKILDANVTKIKMAAVGQQTGSATAFSTTSTSYTDVTGLTAALTTIGRPVLVSVTGYITCERDIAAGEIDFAPSLILLRGATTIGGADPRLTMPTGSTGTCHISFPFSFCVVDAPSAAAHTYKVQVQADAFDTDTTAVVTATIGVFEIT